MKYQNHNENQFVTDSNAVFNIASLSVIGERSRQEDCFGYSLRQTDGIVVVCDGMGGHKSGHLASSTAVNCVLSLFENSIAADNVPVLLRNATMQANTSVKKIQEQTGSVCNAGSTMVAVIIQDMHLFWSSVGDSRAYLFRDGEFVQFTQDQNYRTVLDERLRVGDISEENYLHELSRGEALISYLGIDDLQLIDYNSHPLELTQGDKIILMTDGLYKLLTDEEIRRIIENFSNIGEALQALEMKACRNGKNTHFSRDNMTVALLEIK